jgi:protein gp37
MSTTTGIEWTDATWNPIRGCSRVSEGCRNCYAEKIAGRFRGPGLAYEGLTSIVGGKPVWNGQIHFAEEHLLDPLRWKRVVVPCLKGACGPHAPVLRCRECSTRPRRIFVNSMSDLFHENVTDGIRNRIFAVMLLCPQHYFQILTKRAQEMLAYLGASGRRSEILAAACGLAFDLQSETKYARIPPPSNATDVVYDCGPNGDEAGCRVRDVWPLPNVWLGVSVENQKAADERIPLLLQTPAAVRFLSVEPLLGAVDLTVIPREANVFDVSMPGFDRCKGFFLDALSGSNGVLMLDGSCYEEPLGVQPCLDWVICGGESGPGARPMHPDWARGLRDQCVAAGVPFFFKQWGEWTPGENVERTTGTVETAKWFDNRWLIGAENLRNDEGHRDDEPDLYRVGKKAAGHLLDGEEWHQFPEVRG